MTGHGAAEAAFSPTSLPFIIATIIFVTTFMLIFSEKVHRTVIGMFGAVLMVSFGIFLHFYSPGDALRAIDFNTIGLLLGMMIIVSILETTGFFQYLAILTAKKTKGDPWLLVVAFGSVTTVVSFILDNVTTVVLIVPVTILVCKILKIPASPTIMSEALLSDTGGVGTLVGDPPNIMIGSAAPFTFNDFLLHTMPVVIIAWFATLFTLKWVFRKELAVKPLNIDDLMKMNEEDAMKDWRTTKAIMYVLGLVVLLFFFHHSLHMPPSMVALIGASLCLIFVTPKRDPQPILQHVEWSVLLFFSALFVIVGGLEHASVLHYLASGVAGLAHQNLVV
ncbi:MAG: citrate transporter, partial [Deltaproteobacteria bacterium]